MIRLFVGMRVPPLPALLPLSAELGSLGRSVRVTNPAQWHVTLKFLGETPQHLVERISEPLQESAASFTAFRASATGVGAFPNPQRPRVVWAGVEPATKWQQIASSINRLLAASGFAEDSRPFRPHLTLAYINSQTTWDLPQWLDPKRECEFGQFPATCIELFRSEPTRNGPVYHTMASFQLRASTPES